MHEVIQSENGFGDVTNSYAYAGPNTAFVGVEVWLPDEDVAVDVDCDLV